MSFDEENVQQRCDWSFESRKKLSGASSRHGQKQ